MIVLAPNTDDQEFNIIPRDPELLVDLVLTITEDGTGETETFTDVLANEYGDWTTITQAFTILKENRLYEIKITQDGENWYRGKARCTSLTDTTIKYSLNSTTDNGFLLIEDDETYTII